VLTSGLILYLLSRWEDRVKHKKKIVIAGYSIRCIGFLGYYFVFNPLSLFLVQIVLGFGEAFGVPAYDAIYTKYLDRGKEASEWGAWETMNYVSEGLGAITGGLIVSTKLLRMERRVLGIFTIPE